MHPLLSLVLVGFFLQIGCGDDSAPSPDGAVDAAADTATDAPDAAGDVVDDSPVDGVDGANDAGDAGDPDGGSLPGLHLGDNVCPRSGDESPAVAVAHDGSSAAYVACMVAGASVFVVDLTTAGAAPVLLASTEPTASVEFALDNDHVIYGTNGVFSVRPVDLSARASPLSPGRVLEYRTFLERTSSTMFEPRLMVMDETADMATRRITSFQPNDHYSRGVLLIEGADVGGTLAHLSDSGRTLVSLIAPDAGSAAYQKVRTNAMMPVVAMSFGPADLVMAPTGLGDTHNFALDGDRLVRVELDSPTAVADAVELVASGTGLLPGTHHLFDREDAPGRKHAYFILDGNPSRRLRDATEPLETLADANATAQALSPDRQRVVYVSDGSLYSVSAVGMDTPVVVAAVGAATQPLIVFAPDSSEVVVIDGGGALRRAPIAAEGVSHVVGSSSIRPSSVRYSGDGSTVLWLSGTTGAETTLRASAVGSDASSVVVEGVSEWASIPGNGDVIYVSGGALQRVAP